MSGAQKTRPARTVRNEHSSTEVLKIAGRVLAIAPLTEHEEIGLVTHERRHAWFKWSDIRALAASALNRTADKKPKRSPLKRGKGAKKLGKWQARPLKSRKNVRMRRVMPE